MSTIIKESDSQFTSDICLQRAIGWLVENVGPLETEVNMPGKSWGRGWFALQEHTRDRYVITYLVHDEMLALQFKLIHG